MATGDQIPVLDDVDRKIVDVLAADGRTSMRSLATTLHISRASAYNRVERLEKSGVITGYGARLDPRKLGLGLSAYIYLSISQHGWRDVRDKVLQFENVVHAAMVTGDADIVLLVRTRDVEELRQLVIGRLQEMPEIRSTQTVMIFEEIRSGPL